MRIRGVGNPSDVVSGPLLRRGRSRTSVRPSGLTVREVKRKSLIDSLAGMIPEIRSRTWFPTPCHTRGDRHRSTLPSNRIGWPYLPSKSLFHKSLAEPPDGGGST